MINKFIFEYFKTTFDVIKKEIYMRTFKQGKKRKSVRRVSKMNYIIKMFGNIDSLHRAGRLLCEMGYEPWLYGEEDGTITNVRIEFNTIAKIEDTLFIIAAHKAGVDKLYVYYNDCIGERDYYYTINDEADLDSIKDDVVDLDSVDIEVNEDFGLDDELEFRNQIKEYCDKYVTPIDFGLL